MAQLEALEAKVGAFLTSIATQIEGARTAVAALGKGVEDAVTGLSTDVKAKQAAFGPKIDAAKAEIDSIAPPPDVPAAAAPADPASPPAS